MKKNSIYDDSPSVQKKCNLCAEADLDVGKKTPYGGFVVHTVGSSITDRWFATLSPKTGGDITADFTIQLMPSAHLTHFAQLSQYPALARNYGLAFAQLSSAMGQLIAGNDIISSIALSRESGVSIATYGKCTNWKDKKEHLHIKLFPFRGVMGQPSTVDSTFEKKEVYTDQKTGEEFVKMMPVQKQLIPAKRLRELADRLIECIHSNSSSPIP